MRIGLFTDTYFPQVSGVATSIRTLKEELEKAGHEVYIFTTTDVNVKRYEDLTIIRLPSVPFFAFKDRRVAYRGFNTSFRIAQQYNLDIIHTQTEFALGNLGKMIARELDIPVVHTYHTQYEDYVRYIAKGKIIRPSMVKYLVRAFFYDLDGVICPSRIVSDLLDTYHVDLPKRIIPTGIAVQDYVGESISDEELTQLRQELGLASDDTMLLSLSRVSYEKNIQAVLGALPDVLAKNKKVKLVVVGDGPYLSDLKELAERLDISDAVCFTGMVNHDKVVRYYKASQFFISASTSETQGLTYIESLASGTPIIAQRNPYLDDIVTDSMFGTLYDTVDDLPEAILEAIETTPQMTSDHYQEKLYEISAEHFAKEVYQYYLDLKIAKDFEKENHLENGRVGRLIKGTFALPKTVVVKSSVKTKSMVKKSMKQVRFIRDYWRD